MPAVKTDWKGLSRSGGGDTDTDTDGAFRIDGARRLRHFDDGTAKTVIGSEVIAGLDDDYGSDFIWDSREHTPGSMWARSAILTRTRPTARLATPPGTIRDKTSRVWTTPPTACRAVPRAVF